MNDPKAIIRLPGQGKRLSGAGFEIVHKVRAKQTDGQWSLVQYTAPAGFPGPPPHYHEKMSETFYVLQGTLTVLVGGKTVVAPAGSLISIPPLFVHTINNETQAPATFLLFMSPGGFEDYFDDLAALLAEEGSWPPKDMGKVAIIQSKYDMKLPSPLPQSQ